MKPNPRTRSIQGGLQSPNYPENISMFDDNGMNNSFNGPPLSVVVSLDDLPIP